jgi:hypothetical protein
MNRSANGTEYKSQRQVRSEAQHVAPGSIPNSRSSLKGVILVEIQKQQQNMDEREQRPKPQIS